MSNGSSAARSSSASGCPGRDPGTISTSRSHPGDNSNTQYALLGLNAASEAGVTVGPRSGRSRAAYFEPSQNRDGGWGYTPRHKQSTASMTCAGISSLILTGLEAISGSRAPSAATPSTTAAKADSTPT